MSLELALQANTAAIQQLTALMMGGKFMSADALKAVMTVGHVSGDDEADEELAMNAEEMKTVATVAAVVAQVTPEVPAETPKKIIPTSIELARPTNYEDHVLPVLHKFLVAKGGRAAAESLLKKYGVDKFSRVPHAQLGSLLADINKEMGA